MLILLWPSWGNYSQGHKYVNYSEKRWPTVVYLSKINIEKLRQIDDLLSTVHFQHFHNKNIWVGEVWVGEVRVGDVRVGEVRVGEVRVGDVWVGDVRVGEVRVGDVWWEISRREKFGWEMSSLGGRCLGGRCLGGRSLGGRSLGGRCLGGRNLGGRSPGGRCPVTILHCCTVAKKNQWG